jgi:hypothetical protein
MEKYVPGAGATPVLRTYRVGSAALVAPAPGNLDIWRGFERNPLRIESRLTQHR